MPKRWAAMPPGRRWLIAGIAAVAGLVLLAAIVWALLVPAADALATHDIGSVAGPLHALRLQTARDAARGRLLTLGAGLFAAGALIFTATNYWLSRRTLEVTEQGQVTDRYTKAIEQLGSDKLDVRIGGIYALERIARDSARDHPTVMEVLSAFVREHSHELWPLPAGDEPSASDHGETTRPDVQAAVTVIGRRDPRYDHEPVNLTRADLTGADLAGADLAGAELFGVVLDRAHLLRANLRDANLEYATLIEANLRDANLTEAYLIDANLRDAHVESAKLTGADLREAHLIDANLAGATLTGANLDRVNLAGATLTGADLRDANLADPNLTDPNLTGVVLTGADLTGADLTGAYWPADEVVPEGWKRDTDSGRLRRIAPIAETERNQTE